MSEIAPYATSVLKETYQQLQEKTRQLVSLKQWAEFQAQADPYFFNWLFGDVPYRIDSIDELPQHWQREYKDWLNSLN